MKTNYNTYQKQNKIREKLLAYSYEEYGRYSLYAENRQKPNFNSSPLGKLSRFIDELDLHLSFNNESSILPDYQINNTFSIERAKLSNLKNNIKDDSESNMMDLILNKDKIKKIINLEKLVISRKKLPSTKQQNIHKHYSDFNRYNEAEMVLKIHKSIRNIDKFASKRIDVKNNISMNKYNKSRLEEEEESDSIFMKDSIDLNIKRPDNKKNIYNADYLDSNFNNDRTLNPPAIFNDHDTEIINFSPQKNKKYVKLVNSDSNPNSKFQEFNVDDEDFKGSNISIHNIKLDKSKILQQLDKHNNIHIVANTNNSNKKKILSKFISNKNQISIINVEDLSIAKILSLYDKNSEMTLPRHLSDIDKSFMLNTEGPSKIISLLDRGFFKCKETKIEQFPWVESKITNINLDNLKTASKNNFDALKSTQSKFNNAASKKIKLNFDAKDSLFLDSRISLTSYSFLVADEPKENDLIKRRNTNPKITSENKANSPKTRKFSDTLRNKTSDNNLVYLSGFNPHIIFEEKAEKSCSIDAWKMNSVVTENSLEFSFDGNKK